MKIISPKIHGVIDYLVVVFLVISPLLMGMGHIASSFTYALAIVHLLLTLFTNFNAGLFKIIPLRIHGLIELIVGIGLVILAQTFFKADVVAKTFYTGFGIAVLLVYLLSDYKKATVK